MIIILICSLELCCDGLDKRLIRINNTFHKFSIKCDSVGIFGFFIREFQIFAPWRIGY